MVFSQFVYLQVLVEELKEFVDVLQVQKKVTETDNIILVSKILGF